jgi:hypothetical protein
MGSIGDYINNEISMTLFETVIDFINVNSLEGGNALYF